MSHRYVIQGSKSDGYSIWDSLTSSFNGEFYCDDPVITGLHDMHYAEFACKNLENIHQNHIKCNHEAENLRKWLETLKKHQEMLCDTSVELSTTYFMINQALNSVECGDVE